MSGGLETTARRDGTFEEAPFSYDGTSRINNSAVGRACAGLSAVRAEAS